MTETFYDVLGVSPDAATGEIEDAYRERLKETHPDLNDDEDADLATQRVIEARDVLTDADERARYDRIGHEAYVGEESTSAADEATTRSAAARAAREAGWADDAAEPGESTAAGTNAGPYERRQRERAARERVRADRTSRDRGWSRNGGETGAESVTETTTDGGTSARAAPGGGAARSQQKRDRIYDSSDWATSSGYNVRQDVGPRTHPIRRLIANTSPSLVVSTFFLYPVMLFSTLFPPFPLVVNVTVGLCTVFLVGYLQSRPSVGLLVFGLWSLLVPLGIVVFGLNPTGVVALVALAGVLLPLGFSVLTWSILRL